MIRSVPTARGRTVKALIDVFRSSGYEGATISALTNATGLVRGSLYHHFPEGKKDMAMASLDEVQQIFRDEVLAPLSGKGLSAEERLRATLKRLGDYYEDGRKGCLIAALTLTPERAVFSSKVASLFTEWVAAFAAISRESGATEEVAQGRAEDAVLMIQGALVVGMDGKGHSLFPRILSRIPRLLLTS